MKLLALEFTKRAYRYEQRYRDERWAIYAQILKEPGKIIGFELVKIQKQKDRILPNGEPCAAHEAFPSSEQWGEAGWTLPTFEAAMAKLAGFFAEEMESKDGPVLAI